MKVRVLIVRAPGTNCNEETAYAWSIAGAARVDQVHIRRLLAEPGLIHRYHILTIPGGFSYGDDIAAGKILAVQLRERLFDAVRTFVDEGKLVVGICNGFQVLVKAGLLGGAREAGGEREFTITWNQSGRFEARWVYLRVDTDRSPLLEPGEILAMPVAHAEGRFVARDGAVVERLRAERRVALRYVDSRGAPGGYPVNPNGSEDDIAGLVDETGRVLGLMPHPERYVTETHWPLWTRRDVGAPAPALRVFERGVAYFGR